MEFMNLPSIEKFIGPIKATFPMKVKVSSFYVVHYLSKINSQNLLLMFVNPKLLNHGSAKTFIVFLEKDRSSSLEKQGCFYFRNGDTLKEQICCSASAVTTHHCH